MLSVLPLTLTYAHSPVLPGTLTYAHSPALPGSAGAYSVTACGEACTRTRVYPRRYSVHAPAASGREKGGGRTDTQQIVSSRG